MKRTLLLGTLAALVLGAGPHYDSQPQAAHFDRSGESALLYSSTYDNSGLSQITDRNTMTVTKADGTQVQMTLIVCYEAADATATDWAPCGGITAAGSTLTKVEDGDDFTLAARTPLLDGTTAVRFNGTVGGNAGDYYEAGNTTFADVTTEDLVVEAVFQHSDTSNSGFVAGKAGSGNGWRVMHVTNPALQINDGSGNSTNGINPQGASWQHGIWFLDRSSTVGSMHVINGAQSALVDPTSRAGSLTVAAKFTIGAADGGTNNFAGRFAAIRVWSCAGCLDMADNGQEQATAARRAQQLWGIYPERSAEGLSRGAFARTTVATTPITASGVTRFYRVGTGGPRVGHPPLGTVAGYIAENAATNLALQSETFQTSWTKLVAGDTISADAVADPLDDDVNAADGLITDNNDADHGLTQAMTLTAATYTASVFAKAGTHSWVYVSDNTVANATGYCDIGNCVVGTKGAAVVNHLAVGYGNGWCRCEISFTGTAASHTIQYSVADADGDKVTTGDAASVALYLWQAQVHLGEKAGTPITTTSTTATRNIDDLRYPAQNGRILRGTLVANISAQNFDYLAGTTRGILGLAPGSSTDWTVIHLLGNGDLAECSTRTNSVTSAAVSSTGTDVIDGTRRTIACSYKMDGVNLYLDGVSSGTPDTAAAMATSARDLAIGQLPWAVGTGAPGSGVLIHWVKTYSREEYTQ